jgi:hypothetical protein
MIPFGAYITHPTTQSTRALLTPPIKMLLLQALRPICTFWPHDDGHTVDTGLLNQSANSQALHRPTSTPLPSEPTVLLAEFQKAAEDVSQLVGRFGFKITSTRLAECRIPDGLHAARPLRPVTNEAFEPGRFPKAPPCVFSQAPKENGEYTVFESVGQSHIADPK